MTKEKKTKTKKVKEVLSFKDELIKSKLSKRISPTTLKTIAEQLDKEAALKECVVLLSSFLAICSLDEFIELTTEIKELRNGR